MNSSQTLMGDALSIWQFELQEKLLILDTIRISNSLNYTTANLFLQQLSYNRNTIWANLEKKELLYSVGYKQYDNECDTTGGKNLICKFDLPNCKYLIDRDDKRLKEFIKNCSEELGVVEKGYTYRNPKYQTHFEFMYANYQLINFLESNGYGIHKIYSIIRETNTQALAFSKRLGFIPVLMYKEDNYNLIVNLYIRKVIGGLAGR